MGSPELLQRPIRFNTVNPPGNEVEALDFLRGLLDEAGWLTEILAKVPERPNVVARLKGAAPGPTLALDPGTDRPRRHGAGRSERVAAQSVGRRSGRQLHLGTGALDMKDQRGVPFVPIA